LRGKRARELRRAAAAAARESDASNKTLIWRHTKDVGLLLACELGIELALILSGRFVPELQRMVDAVQPVLEFSAAATIGSLALETPARMLVRLWIELASVVGSKEGLRPEEGET
jgi:hypothetical protein